MTRPLCFLDTETDGLHPGRRAWEIAIIRREPDGEETTWEAMLDIDLQTADASGLRVGRFYERHPYGRFISGRSRINPRSVLQGWPLLEQREAAEQVARLTHGALIVGAVPNFDTETLTPLLHEHGLTPAWHYRLRCVQTLAAGYLRRDIGSLHDCAEALGITPHDEHTALGDALTAQAIYDHVMEAS